MWTGIQQTLLVATRPAHCALSATLGVLPGLLPQFSPSDCEHLTHGPPFIIQGPAWMHVPLI